MLRRVKLSILLCLLLAIATNQGYTENISVINDQCKVGGNELAVANLVISWSYKFIGIVGNNIYDNGEASTIEVNIFQSYQDFIFPATHSYNSVTTQNANITLAVLRIDYLDRQSGVAPYLYYFALNNNEGFYDVEYT